MNITRTITLAIAAPLCVLLTSSAVAEDYVLSGALPNSSWTEMGPCSSFGHIVFPIEAQSCGAAGGNHSTTSSFVRAESGGLYSAIFQWIDGTYIKHVKINFKIENGVLYAKGVSAGYDSASGRPFPFDFNERPFTAQTYANTTNGSGYGIKGLTFHVLANGLVVSSLPAGIGDPSPNHGTVALESGATLPVSCPAVWTNAAGTVGATCVGWKLYDENRVLVSNGTETAFTYHHPASGGHRRLEWQWNASYKVSASAGAGGSVSPSEQWVAHGATATVTATGDGGLAFSKWTGNLAGSARYANPAVFTVTGPCEMAARFGTPDQTWTWIGTANNLSWTTAANWSKPAGATTDYPDGAEDSVVFNYYLNGPVVKLDGEFFVRGITINGKSGGTARNNREAPVFGDGGGTLHIGADGVVGNHLGWGQPIPSFNCDVILEGSQDWLFPPWTDDAKNNDCGVDLLFSRTVSCAAGGVWRVRCPGGIQFDKNSDTSGFLGTFLSGTRLQYIRRSGTSAAKVFGNAASVVAVNDPDWGPGDGYGGSLAASKLGIVSSYVNFAGEPIPFNFSFDYTSTASGKGTPYLIFCHPANNSAADYHTIGYTQEVARAISGTFSGSLNICGSDPQTRFGGIAANGATIYFPDRQRIRFSGDNRDLVATSEGYIVLRNILAVAAHTNAFGVGNAIPIKTAFFNTYASFCGLLAENGITVRAPLSRGSESDYWLIFGAADSDSSCLFTGTIACGTSNPLRLTAPARAKARFEGVISGLVAGEFKDKCLEVFGGGDIELAAANTFAANPNIRHGRLLLACNGAANNKKIYLGGFIPGPDIHVRLWRKANSFPSMTAAADANFNKGEGFYTATSAGDYTLQGVTLREGDLILQNGNPEFGAKEGIYKAVLLPDGKMQLTNQLSLVTNYGQRIDVDEGDSAGEYLYFIRQGNIARQHILEDVRNPDVAVAISADGVTHSGAIAVVNNYSSGTSTIGMAASGTGTFSGAVTLARGVTFTAEKADSVLALTGAISDIAGTTNAIAFGGVGKVVFGQSIDFTDRTLSFAPLSKRVLEAGGARKYILAEGDFTNLDKADVVLPANSGWIFHIEADSFSVSKPCGTFLMVQ